jgi:hypothetical protein
LKNLHRLASVALVVLLGCSSNDDAQKSDGAAASGGSSGAAGGAGGAHTGAGGAAGHGAGGATGGGVGGATTAGTGGAAGHGTGGVTGGGTGGVAGTGTGGVTGSGVGGTAGTGVGGTAGAGVGGSTSSVDAGGTDAPAGCASKPYSDDFSGTMLDPCWTVLNGSASSPFIMTYETNGALHLQAMPTPDGVWYQGSTKSLVYKLVTAMRFKLTTTVHPRKRTDMTSPPTQQLHVGGLMVRNPSSMGNATENYLFIMMGHPEGNSGVEHPGIEVKSTVNGGSAYKEPDWGAIDADLRMCRIDSNFYLYARVPGTATWTLISETGAAAPVSRPDLPATVQLGMALNFSAGADLDVAFDQITMSATAPATPADCTSD